MSSDEPDFEEQLQRAEKIADERYEELESRITGLESSVATTQGNLTAVRNTLQDQIESLEARAHKLGEMISDGAETRQILVDLCEALDSRLDDVERGLDAHDEALEKHDKRIRAAESRSREANKIAKRAEQKADDTDELLGGLFGDQDSDRHIDYSDVFGPPALADTEADNQNELFDELAKNIKAVFPEAQEFIRLTGTTSAAVQMDSLRVKIDRRSYIIYADLNVVQLFGNRRRSTHSARLIEQALVYAHKRSR